MRRNNMLSRIGSARRAKLAAYGAKDKDVEKAEKFQHGGRINRAAGGRTEKQVDIAGNRPSVRLDRAPRGYSLGGQPSGGDATSQSSVGGVGAQGTGSVADNGVPADVSHGLANAPNPSYNAPTTTPGMPEDGLEAAIESLQSQNNMIGGPDPNVSEDSFGFGDNGFGFGGEDGSDGEGGEGGEGGDGGGGDGGGEWRGGRASGRRHLALGGSGGPSASSADVGGVGDVGAGSVGSDPGDAPAGEGEAAAEGGLAGGAIGSVGGFGGFGGGVGGPGPGSDGYGGEGGEGGGDEGGGDGGGGEGGGEGGGGGGEWRGGRTSRNRRR